MPENLIFSILIIISFAVVVTSILTKFKVHPIIGFIVTGAIIGPNGLKLITDPHKIESISEIGVMLLLFTLGLEFSISKLIRLKKYVFTGGGLQVLITFFIFSVFGFYLFGDYRNAIILGLLTALSSTAIVLKLLVDNRLVDAPIGKGGLGILLFQDIMVVPIMIMVPLMADNNIDIFNIFIKILKSFGLGLLVFFIAKYLTNYLLSKIVKLRVRELFILTIIVISLGTGYITGSMGISVSLGAFLAGVVLADSVYTHQIIAYIQPFKDSFLALFFISIGLLADVGYILTNIADILIFLFSLLLIKGGIIFVVTYFLINSFNVSFRIALSLFQIGEFSFVVAALSKNYQIIDDNFYQLFLAVSIFSMVFTPYFFKYANKVYNLLFSKFDKTRDGQSNVITNNELSDHVIIVGYGINGRNLSHVLKETDIKYIISEMNIDTVKEFKAKGEPIIFGDATKEEILHQLNLETAKIMVIAISDPDATKRIVKLARSIKEDIHIIVRTRYVAEVDMFKRLGADEIIPEEFETSIEIFSRVLYRYNIPVNVINKLVRSIRENNYEALRMLDLKPKKLNVGLIDDISIDVVPYEVMEDSNLNGQKILDIDLRRNTGASIIALRRGDMVIQSPTAEDQVFVGDIIYITGTKEVVEKAIVYLDNFEVEAIA
ncbi:MAG: cation:proton antiporter [Deferribacterales bacterium]